MAGSSIDRTAPGLTRLVRASALLAAQGAAVGFGLSTIEMWSRLKDFATTNKISSSERMGLLGWLAIPAAAWVAVWMALAVTRAAPHRRLALLEGAAQRYSWAIGIAFVPMLLHPTLWQTRSLMFLISASVATLVVWWAMRVTHKGVRDRQLDPCEPPELVQILDYLASVIPGTLKVVVPYLAIGALVLYIAAKGVWIDAPKAAHSIPSSTTTLRQAMTIVGHGGWLGLPLAFSLRLRAAGEAHLLLWAIAVSVAALPLYAWSKHHLGTLLALFVALAYLSVPMLRTCGRAELLPLGAAAGFFYWASLEWERARTGRALVATLLTVGVHEQAALWFTCFGIYLALCSRRETRGRWLAVGSLSYFLAVAFVWLPHYDQPIYEQGFRGMWGQASVGLLGTLAVALTNPAHVVSKWLELQSLPFWLALFVPFGFLPVSGRRWLLWVLPGIVFAIIAPGRAPTLPVNAGTTAHFIVLGFTASVMTLARLRGTPRTRPQANAAVVAWAFALVPTVYQFGSLWISAP